MPKQSKPQPAITYKSVDKIKYNHPSHGWIDGTFEDFHTPGLAPAGCRWSFMEISIKGKIHRAYSLNQIKLA